MYCAVLKRLLFKFLCHLAGPVLVDACWYGHSLAHKVLSLKGYVVSCRFHSAVMVFLSVCKFVMSSVVHYCNLG